MHTHLDGTLSEQQAFSVSFQQLLRFPLNHVPFNTLTSGRHIAFGMAEFRSSSEPLTDPRLISLFLIALTTKSPAADCALASKYNERDE